jgi:hypothetical protein
MHLSPPRIKIKSKRDLSNIEMRLASSKSDVRGTGECISQAVVLMVSTQLIDGMFQQLAECEHAIPSEWLLQSVEMMFTMMIECHGNEGSEHTDDIPSEYGGEAGTC